MQHGTVKELLLPLVVEVFGALSKFIGPVDALLTAAIVWLHQRISSLEDKQDRQDISLFGDDADPLHTGALEDIRSLQRDVAEIKESQTTLTEAQAEILEHLRSMNPYSDENQRDD